MAEANHLHSPSGSTPVPDPTLLTTAALTREIAALKELMATRLDAMDKAQALFEVNLTRVPTDTDKQIQHLKELHDGRFTQLSQDTNLVREITATRLQVVETRFDGMDKAIELVHDGTDKLPPWVDEKIAALKGLQDEKFASINNRFQERDVRSEQQKKDNEVSVGAALQAAKEAVAEQNKSSSLAIAKSETATQKQIDQLGLLIQSVNEASNDKIADIKERLTRIEGKSEGAGVEKVTHGNAGNQVILIVSVLIALAALLFGIYEAAAKH
jgi:hypothetical protein